MREPASVNAPQTRSRQDKSKQSTSTRQVIQRAGGKEKAEARTTNRAEVVAVPSRKDQAPHRMWEGHFVMDAVVAGLNLSKARVSLRRAGVGTIKMVSAVARGGGELQRRREHAWEPTAGPTLGEFVEDRSGEDGGLRGCGNRGTLGAALQWRCHAPDPARDRSQGPQKTHWVGHREGDHTELEMQVARLDDEGSSPSIDGGKRLNGAAKVDGCVAYGERDEVGWASPTKPLASHHEWYYPYDQNQGIGSFHGWNGEFNIYGRWEKKREERRHKHKEREEGESRGWKTGSFGH
ncbi:hypothetical protein BJY52DRAFT_1228489 [Lactarius psammicola]|nr:hypothetical protein BJY52DRAFT_1228489 [Lactarius psammicola]